MADGIKHLLRRIRSLSDIDAQGDKGSRIDRDEFPTRLTAIQFYPAESLVVALFAKINTFQAATVDDGRQPFMPRGQVLMLMDMTQRHIIPGWIGNLAEQHRNIAPNHDTPFAAKHCACHREMSRQDTRRIRLSSLLCQNAQDELQLFL